MPRQPKDDWLELESELSEQGYARIAGLDEAGCGPLAGPVVAACVLLPPNLELPLLNDSKKLSEKVRLQIYDRLLAEAEIGVGRAEPAEIDRINIRQATYLAMRRAVEALSLAPDYLLVDCWQLSFWQGAQQGIVRGDAKVRSIAAASVVAKTVRDRLMKEADSSHPGYEFARHKGYPTARHYQLLSELGPCPLHRQSFLGKLRQVQLGDAGENDAGENDE